MTTQRYELELVVEIEAENFRDALLSVAGQLMAVANRKQEDGKCVFDEVYKAELRSKQGQGVALNLVDGGLVYYTRD